MNAATIKYLSVATEEMDHPMSNVLRLRRAPMVSGRPARILIAEDDAEMRQMLVSTFRSEGYEVVEAANGAALLEEVSMLLFSGQAVPVDLIISDERMPGMLGSEVLAGLRESHWPTPFILITGFGDRQIHQRAYQMGARAIFDKPFDLDQLRETVAEVLERG